MGRDGLHFEWTENERQDERCRRLAVVDDDPESALDDRSRVERREQIACVALTHANRVADLADPVRCRPPQLVARVVLLDLLLEPRRQLCPGVLEEPDLELLGIDEAHPDVEAGCVALRADEMAVDGRRQDAKVGDADACRREAGDHCPLDHAARRRCVPAGDDTSATLKGGSERGGQPNRCFRRQIDVDDAGDAFAAEQMRRATALPDEALVDGGARLHLLVRKDADVGHDDRLRPERDTVAEGGAVVHVDVRAQVARLADDRTLDARAAPDERRLVDDRPHDAGAFAEPHVRAQHRVGADRRLGRDGAVVADEGRAFDACEVVDLHAFTDPDVAAQPDARDVERDLLVESVEVRLPVLLEVPDVLPVAVADVAVHRPAELEQPREELLREVERTVVGHVAEHAWDRGRRCRC